MSNLIYYNVVGFGVLGFVFGILAAMVIPDRLDKYKIWYLFVSFILIVPIVSLMCLGHSTYFGRDWHVLFSVTSNAGWYAIFFILFGEVFFARKSASLSIKKAETLDPRYEPPPFGGR